MFVTETIYPDECSMAGKIKQTLDKLIQARSKGNQTLVFTTITKLMLKGIDYNKYTETSEDDPVMLEKIATVAKDMGVTI
jgi:hypothetical protein